MNEETETEILQEALDHIEFLMGKWTHYTSNVHPNDERSLKEAKDFLAEYR